MVFTVDAEKLVAHVNEAEKDRGNVARLSSTREPHMLRV